MNTVHNLCQ